jgi:hypothetical protein
VWGEKFLYVNELRAIKHPVLAWGPEYTSVNFVKSWEKGRRHGRWAGTWNWLAFVSCFPWHLTLFMRNTYCVGQELWEMTHDLAALGSWGSNTHSVSQGRPQGRTGPF